MVSSVRSSQWTRCRYRARRTGATLQPLDTEQLVAPLRVVLEVPKEAEDLIHRTPYRDF